MLKTFSIGGIHPEENKLSTGSPLKQFQLPTDIKEVRIPIVQHIGAPAQPIVAVGDDVKVGQIIAQAGGFVSSNIHAPFSGKVKKIETMPGDDGKPAMMITIAIEGDEWVETIDRSTGIKRDITLSGEEIVKKIGEMGIVGMGGARFPAQVKLGVKPGQAQVLIINGVECEPYLTADHRLMLEKSEEVLIGVKILMKAIGVTEAYIGIENNKKDAIDLLTKLSASYQGIHVQPLKMKYPQGGEKQLIDACIGRQVASGALPISVGAVVQNVGTAYAVYEAVQKNKPLIERVVCVTGKTLQTPTNFWARIGTPVKALIDAAGGVPEDCGKIIGGGPMMGRAFTNIEVPIHKGSSGILLMNKKESARGEIANCIRCAKCVSACPMGLEPFLLSKLSAKSMWDEAEQNHITDCIECGSCSFTCPSNRPLLDYIRLGKGKVMGIIRARAAAAKAAAEAKAAEASK